MRVLWFTNGPVPALAEKFGLYCGVGGGWMSALAEQLRARADVALAIATAVAGARSGRAELDGITYYLMPQPAWRNGLSHSAVDLDHAEAAVRDFKPDIIHVHGTERFNGLIRERVDGAVPVVISVQGILSRYCAFRYAGMTVSEKVAMLRLRDVLRARGTVFEWLFWRTACRRERKIFAINRYFMGRTEWDRAWTSVYSPSSRYFRCDEILRGPFYAARWRIDGVRRRTLLVTGGQNPMKGIYDLLEAAAILKAWGAPATILLAGDWVRWGEFGRPLARRIRSLGLEREVEYVGSLKAGDLAKAMATSHVFVSPSHIDNSPNSVTEAMLVGMPCVASFVGGVPSLLENGRSGILVPPADPAMLASAIRRVLTDDELAVSLGACAHELACRRYDPRAIADEQVRIYREILRDTNAAERVA